MAETARGYVYPDATAHTRLWEHLQDLAESVQDDIAAASGSATNASTTNTTTSTSATPVPGSTVVGVTFVAPPSGRVLITAPMIINASVAAGNGSAGFMVKTGGSIGSGTTVYDCGTEPQAKMAQNGYIGALAGTVCDVVEGLTPGATYNAYCAHWTGSGNISFFSQKITVLPQL